LAEAPVVGKTLLVNGTPFTITGVAAPGFHSMVWGQTPAVFVPLSMEQVLTPEWMYLGDRKTLLGRRTCTWMRGQKASVRCAATCRLR
jgi:putative ABC transport system permease protein